MFENAPRAGFIRRLAAILYDWLILAALWMLAMGLSMVLVALLNSVGVISLTNYIDHADFITKNNIWFQLYSVLVFLWFYVYFWYKGGQTLGMRAWRLFLVQQNGDAITYKQAFIRAFTALLGLGNLWLFIRFGKKLALQDELSNTQVIVLTKEQSKVLNLHRAAK